MEKRHPEYYEKDFWKKAYCYRNVRGQIGWLPASSYQSGRRHQPAGLSKSVIQLWDLYTWPFRWQRICWFIVFLFIADLIFLEHFWSVRMCWIILSVVLFSHYWLSNRIIIKPLGIYLKWSVKIYFQIMCFCFSIKEGWGQGSY